MCFNKTLFTQTGGCPTGPQFPIATLRERVCFSGFPHIDMVRAFCPNQPPIEIFLKSELVTVVYKFWKPDTD